MTRTAAALLVLALSLPAVAQTPPPRDRVAAAIKPLADRGLSGVVLVTHRGKTVWHEAYGLAERGSGRANTVRTLFDVGSVAKQFTAAAVLKLQTQGKLRTTDTLATHLPDTPKEMRSITLLQLLSHTSGLPRGYDFAGVDLRVRDKMVAAVLRTPLAAAPGEKFAYSNANYFLLAAIVERASGVKYEDYVRTALFTPAKMRDTGFCGEKRLDLWRAARRYEGARDLGSSVDYWFSWGHRGATGVVTTSGDMLRWHAALAADTVLSATARKTLFTPVKDGYACGWYVLPASDKGPRRVMHAGSAAGARAYFSRFPDSDSAIIILLNATAEPRDLTHWTVANAVRRALFAPSRK